jgi:opacity protein-like surface antigen
VNGGLNYAYSTFDGIGIAPDVNEHEFSATAGLGYQVWNNVSVDANYSYTVLSSDDNLRDYDRNRISLGLSAQF